MIRDFLNSFDTNQLPLIIFVAVMLGLIAFELIKFIIFLFRKK